MDGDRKIGGAPLLAVICVGVVVFVFANSSGEPPAQPTDASTKIAPSAKAPHPAPVKIAPELDFSSPVQTASRAIVCSQNVLIEAMVSRAADSPMERVYAAFNSGFDRASKVKAAGCEEWRAGIRLYNVQKMDSPFSEFVGFGLDPNGMADYFTKANHLANVP